MAVNTDSLRKLWKTVFGDSDAFLDSFFRIAFSPERCKYLEADGEAICALYWFDCSFEGGKLAYIYAVATHPEYRGKGLASRLMADTHVHLQNLGYAGTVLKPAKGLFPFYERLGYATSGFISRFPVNADATPAEIKELSAAEYGRLRPAYLPKDAVTQDGLTLEFLHAFAKFYASDDAILCVCRDEPVVFEYLGNLHSAPGILCALGIHSAEIPTIGSDIPFTMYHPLNCTKIPGYLGITLE
jgi:GNAT superfamily N-acetyltransferase